MKPRPWLPTLAVAAVAAALCALLAPVVLNGDGLGYLKASPTGIVRCLRR